MAVAEATETEQVDQTDEADEPTFTQQQVSDVAAAEKAKATRAAAKKARAELEAEMGMTVDEVKALADQKAKADEAQMTEAEKVRREADELKREAEKLRAENLRERLNIRAERALAEAGAVTGISRLVKLLDLADDADDDAIAEAIAELKADMPAIFTETEPGSDDTVPPTGRSGVSRTGSQPPKNPVPVTSGVAAGRQRFRNNAAATSGPTPLERLQGKTA